MRFTTAIKRLIYPLYIYPKISQSRKKSLQFSFSNKETKELDNLKLFSNTNEDGIILKLIASLKITKGYFIDIGSNDCINSNCANLAFNFEWDGIFIDADKSLLEIGERCYNFFNRKSGLKFLHSFVYPETINDFIKSHIENNVEVDFVSIDIDGNDFAIWEALSSIKPKIVVVENKIEYGKYEIVVPVTDRFTPNEWGASIVSFTKMSEEKGYTLVATNTKGFNAFYLRNDCFKISGIESLNIDTVLNNKAINVDFFGAAKMKDLLNKI